MTTTEIWINFKIHNRSQAIRNPEEKSKQSVEYGPLLPNPEQPYEQILEGDNKPRGWIRREFCVRAY